MVKPFSSLAFMFLLLAIDTNILNIECDGYFKGQVFVMSEEVILCFRQAYRKIRLESRYAKSMKGIKIYVGSQSYYDRLFALNVLDFNITQTVNLLLL